MEPSPQRQKGCTNSYLGEGKMNMEQSLLAGPHVSHRAGGKSVKKVRTFLAWGPTANHLKASASFSNRSWGTGWGTRTIRIRIWSVRSPLLLPNDRRSAGMWVAQVILQPRGKPRTEVRGGSVCLALFSDKVGLGAQWPQLKASHSSNTGILKPKRVRFRGPGVEPSNLLWTSSQVLILLLVQDHPARTALEDGITRSW